MSDTTVNKKKRHQNIPASYLVLMSEDQKVLLLRRWNTGFEDGMYSLVAGHVEPGETFSAALIREAQEEAGVIINFENIQTAHIMHRKSHTDASERVDVFHVVKNWDGEVTNMEPEKCDNLAWFSLSELPENLIPYIRCALENICDGSMYSEFGW